MNQDILYALALFFAAGFGFALGRDHAHKAFNRVMGETLAAILKHLRAEGGEARETRRSAAMMARLAVGFAETAEKDPAARELKAINESLQHAKSAETTAKTRFEQLYNDEKKAREVAERRSETLRDINQGLARRMAAPRFNERPGIGLGQPLPPSRPEHGARRSARGKRLLDPYLQV